MLFRSDPRIVVNSFALFTENMGLIKGNVAGPALGRVFYRDTVPMPVKNNFQVFAAVNQDRKSVV